MIIQRKLRRFLIAGALLAMLIASAPVLASAKAGTDLGGHDRRTQFYVPPPNHDAIRQIAQLVAKHKRADARLITEMIATPQAVWFTKGTPKSVKQDVKLTIKLAGLQHAVPVLVAYNIPFRDCAQFSAGGATTVQAYKDWIDGFAAGIGNSKAIVLIEPDGLGIIPWYKQFRDLPSEGGYEWCQPAEADPATAADDRFALLNYAVDALKAKPNVSVYLDGTHSAWLGSGDAAHRLVQAGVQRADGFYLNVSNYRLTEHLQKYGTWISKCIAFANNPEEGGWRLGHYDWCASQYFPANPNDFSTWHLSDEWYDANLGSAVPTAHFVIDTSRNGQGPWTPTTSYPDAQDWCNPPDRGLGLRPTADTGIELLDAYLWVKIPGESDGECTRGLGPAGTTVDPEWGRIDPPAGGWFPEMALDLVHNANPPLH